MKRVFLDANVLFSAAWRPNNGLLVLWQRPDLHLLSSDYAAAEARRNLPDEARRQRLQALVAAVELVVTLHPALMAPLPTLRDKDRPIVWAAVQGRADVLLTGDLRDFGPWFGQSLLGVTVLQPTVFLQMPRAV